MSEIVHFRLDGRSISARPGQTVLEAADAAGATIPRLCHLPGVRPHGACRVCTCMIDGRPQTACTYPVSEGLDVRSDSGELRALRRDLIEMALVEGNHFCMFCEKSGRCELQALAYAFGITHLRHEPLGLKRDVDATHPDLWIDRNRCIQCGRCVRAARDLDHKQTYQFTYRGHRQRVEVNAAEGLGATDASLSDAASSACPVGALLPKRRGFDEPIGRRRFDLEPLYGSRPVSSTGSREGGGR